MRKQILFIYNPSAGKNRAEDILPKAIGQLCSDNCRVITYPTLKGYGAEKIIAEEAGNFDRVLCCGGDGTLNHTINGLMALDSDKKPVLGYIPSGSTNDFASSMGIKDVISTCRSVAYGQPFYYDIGRFNESYFNYVAAFGAFTQVSYTTPQSTKNQLGHLAYVIEAMRHLPLGSYHTAKVTVNGETFTDDFFFGSISNSTSVGGMNIDSDHSIQMNDGLFEVILVKSPKGVNDLNDIVQALVMRNFEGSSLRYFKTDKITIEFEEETQWTLDGEFGGNIKEAAIEVIPKAVGLLK
ncbi:MAG: YegS/Rv2252/BmrU family lipid kinase [Oscillospiraceae bacterium]|nr:YegS/Rv2252/BmrU family lipid kinase [Oscillospiraceae bacterium]